MWNTSPAITGDTPSHIGPALTAPERPGRERGWQPLTDDELAVQALISQRQGRILRAQSKYLLSSFAHPWNLLGARMCPCHPRSQGCRCWGSEEEAFATWPLRRNSCSQAFYGGTFFWNIYARSPVVVYLSASSPCSPRAASSDSLCYLGSTEKKVRRLKLEKFGTHWSFH